MSFVDNDKTLTERAWFKPAVGLWFGMLVGAGALGVLYVTPEATRDGLFQSTGLAGLHRFFEPPVGMAGFAAVAIVAGLLGLLLGLVIASRLARSSAPEAWTQDEAPSLEPAPVEPAESEDGRRRVFSARDDIGEEGIAITETAEARDPALEEEIGAESDEAYFEDVQDAEFEEAVEPQPVAAPAQASLAELSLDELSARLAAALAASKARGARGKAAPAAEEPDQVISFLRREAARDTTPGGSAGEDPQAALRSALDKLGRVGKPD